MYQSGVMQWLVKNLPDEFQCLHILCILAEALYCSTASSERVYTGVLPSDLFPPPNSVGALLRSDCEG